MSAASAVLSRIRGGKILVASPRAELRKQILETLAFRAAQAAEAVGGADALMRLEQSEFRTLLLDSQLEDLDVEELVGKIRDRYPQLNVVLLNRADESKQLSFDLTADSFDSSRGELPARNAQEESPVAQTGAVLSEYPYEASANISRETTAVIGPIPGIICRRPTLTPK